MAVYSHWTRNEIPNWGELEQQERSRYSNIPLSEEDKQGTMEVALRIKRKIGKLFYLMYD